MITTVTTTTTTAVTSVAAASFTMIVTLLLVTLLIQNEIIGSVNAEWSQRVLQRVRVVIPPLFAVFVVSVAVRIFDLLAS